MPRLYTQSTVNRVKIRGMGKGELVDIIHDWDPEIPKSFLRRFTPAVLYSAMRLAQSGKRHSIFSKWENERDGVPF